MVMEVTAITPTGGEHVTYTQIEVRYRSRPIFLRILGNFGPGAVVHDRCACRAMDYYAAYFSG